MLTADYDTLGLQAGDRLLDMGCGFGRHAFEAIRRGAHVVALDYSFDELTSVCNTVAAMDEAGELSPESAAMATRGNALELPFMDGSFDRIIASEVMEHLDDDRTALAELVRVLRPGGTIAVTVPAWLPERICWALSDDYHAPIAEGGHVRIYSKAELRMKMMRAGLDINGSSKAHALHAPYWWLRCAVGPGDESNLLVKKYKKLLEWDIMTAPKVTRVAEQVLNPAIGKSIVLYGTKPEAA